MHCCSCIIRPTIAFQLSVQLRSRLQNYIGARFAIFPSALCLVSMTHSVLISGSLGVVKCFITFRVYGYSAMSCSLRIVQYFYYLNGSCLVQWNKQYETNVNSCSSILYSNLVEQSVYGHSMCGWTYLRCTFSVPYWAVSTVYISVNLVLWQVSFWF